MLQRCIQLTTAVDELSRYRAFLDRELSRVNTDNAATSDRCDISVATDGVWTTQITCNELAILIININPVTRAEAVLRALALRAYVSSPDLDDRVQSICLDLLRTERIGFGKDSSTFQKSLVSHVLRSFLRVEKLTLQSRQAIKLVNHSPYFK